MTQQSHWTEESTDALAHRIAFDFIAQIENRMDEMPMKQSDLARKLGVSEGAVSKLLNNPQNLTIRTIAKYARALGIKAAIVAYDDGDRENKRGPVHSEIFASCWNWAGKPHDVWDLEKVGLQRCTTEEITPTWLSFRPDLQAYGYGTSAMSCISTSFGIFDTSRMPISLITQQVDLIPQGATSTYARD